jgi:hypothetical protein
MRKLSVFLLFVFCILQPVHADCIPVSGLAFEKIDSNKLLAISNGKNIAIISISYEILPASISQFRFFSEQLCDSGAEAQFHIDGKLFRVAIIQKFSK